jgi:hypothetical protein
MPRYDFTPKERLPMGTALHPAGLSDPVIREPRPITTGDIRLKASAATVAGSVGYDFGPLTRKSVGTYEVRWQPAPVDGGPEIGAPKYAWVEVYENTAGVFLARLRTEREGGTAIDDGADLHSDEADFEVSGDIGSNDKIYFAVLTSTGVTNAGARPGLRNAAVGHLVLLNAKSTTELVFSVTRQT